ncbi:MAG: hypothetical protein L6Q92_06185 [Phycisphaerae bacterium]|nr:hypothetical protein [Phycisphaerae bacterium]
MNLLAKGELIENLAQVLGLLILAAASAIVAWFKNRAEKAAGKSASGESESIARDEDAPEIEVIKIERIEPRTVTPPRVPDVPDGRRPAAPLPPIALPIPNLSDILSGRPAARVTVVPARPAALPPEPARPARLPTARPVTVLSAVPPRREPFPSGFSRVGIASKRDLRRAILLREILGPPVALRDEPWA